MPDAAERPLASEEPENRVKESFPIDVPLAEFAARNSYGWLDFPCGRYPYRDTELDEWIQAVKETCRPQRGCANVRQNICRTTTSCSMIQGLGAA
jgi:hypothetical protein